MTPLTKKYKPKRVQDFAGLAGPRGVLRKFTESPYVSAWLFVGDAGTGKTSMAYAVAENIGGEIHHIPSRSCDLETVRKVAESCHYMPMFGGLWNFVIVDEADQMTAAAQLAFLSMLDGSEAPPNTVFLFTANSTKKLEPRFISRTRVLQFDLQSDADAAVSHLRTIWIAETGGSNPPDFRAMFADSGNNIRDCLMKLEIEVLMHEGAPVFAPEPTAPISSSNWASLLAGFAHAN